MVAIKVHTANRANYGRQRPTSDIKYIVIHYTANDGDTDENNGKYFANNVVKSSAHYFVDDDSITQSVPDNYVGYSVGGNRYANYKQTGGAKFYKICTNSNSISIELCDDVKNGVIYPSAKTIENALDLARLIMSKYKIPADCVIRHFDVNGKPCPAYWVDETKWKTEFWNKLGGASTPVATESKPAFPYRVRINTAVLNVRNGAGTNHKINTTVKRGEVYTIVSESNGWGKLKSGAGWIKLSYTIKA
jgi:N-acetylmuramoyl-L-alanine amidase CwlA